MRSRADWLVPAALVALSLVPVIAGGARMANLAGGVPVTVEDGRFFVSPAPVVAHIIAASLYGILGAFQFSRGLRRRHPSWHRRLGTALVACGLVAAASGLWMAQVYPRIATDSLALYLVRLAVGGGMIAAILLAVAAIRRRDFKAHGAWMIRTYALGVGAGMQVFTHLPWFIFVGEPGPVSRAALMTAGWAINIAISEWTIRKVGLSRRPCSERFAIDNL